MFTLESNVHILHIWYKFLHNKTFLVITPKRVTEKIYRAKLISKDNLYKLKYKNDYAVYTTYCEITILNSYNKYCLLIVLYFRRKLENYFSGFNWLAEPMSDKLQKIDTDWNWLSLIFKTTFILFQKAEVRKLSRLRNWFSCPSYWSILMQNNAM
jgi:hypothetical protein